MGTTKTIRRLSAIALAGSMLALAACDDDGEDITAPDGDGVGTLVVTVTTDGDIPDPNGYNVLLLDGEQTVAGPAPVGGAAGPASVTLGNVPSGTYRLSLTDLEGNCTADNNPRDVVVPAADTARVAFTVNCL